MMGRRRRGGVMEFNDERATTEMTWQADGETWRLVRFEAPNRRDGFVDLLQELMGCSDEEAEEAVAIMFDERDFVASVVADIERLPTVGTT